MRTEIAMHFLSGIDNQCVFLLRNQYNYGIHNVIISMHILSIVSPIDNGNAFASSLSTHPSLIHRLLIMNNDL